MSNIIDENQFEIRIDKNGILKEVDISEYFISIKELKKIKKAIDFTLKFYSENDLTEVGILNKNKKIDNNLKKKQIEKNKNALTPFVEYYLPLSERKSHLYLIHNLDANTLKIGKSTNIKQRIANIQTGNHCNLQLLFVIKNNGHLEGYTHNKFERFNIKKEWFLYDESIITYFKNSVENGVQIL